MTTLIPFESPEYPMPADYWTLTDEGQRLARVNGLRQWTLHASDPVARGNAFASCLNWFDNYYLMPEVDDSGNVTFDPYFYDSPLPSPFFHSVFYRHALRFRQTALVGPRGGAKSYMIAKPIIMMMASHPVYSFTYATSADDLAEGMGERCKYQLYNNSRLNDDFGKLQPRRSEGRQGMGAFALTNRSTFFATSAQSRQRGLRPFIYILDDPEYDPRASTSMENLREGMHELIFKIALPMVQRAHTRLWWTGTFVSRRHYLWHAMSVNESGAPIDDRFGQWCRLVVRIAEESSGRLVSCWPEMWPTDAAERDSLKLDPGTQTLEEVRRTVGESVWQSEYMANPGAGDGSYFPPPNASHEYWFEEPDEALVASPYLSRSYICWRRDSGTIRMPLREFCARYPRFICVDSAYTATKASDWQVAHCMSVTEKNELFSLDLWSEKCPRDRLVRESFKMAETWRAKTIHPENIREGHSVCESLLDICRMRANDVVGCTWLATVIPYNPGMVDKTARMDAALKWRFDYGKVKLPFAKRNTHPYRHLFNQIEGFNPYAKDGGLEKDDHLDTLAMHRHVVGGVPRSRETAEIRPLTPLERMKKGETLDASGLPLAYSVLPHATSGDLLDILESRRNPAPKEPPV